MHVASSGTNFCKELGFSNGAKRAVALGYKHASHCCNEDVRDISNSESGTLDNALFNFPFQIASSMRSKIVSRIISGKFSQKSLMENLALHQELEISMKMVFFILQDFDINIPKSAK